MWIALALVMVTAPFGVAVVSSERGSPLTIAASITWLHFALMVFVAALAFLARWRLLAEPVSGWVATALLVIGFCLMPFALDSAAELGFETPDTGVAEMVTATVAAALLHAAATGLEPTRWRHPFLLGAVLGCLVTVLQEFPMAEEVRERLTPVLTVALAVIVVVIIRAMLRLPDLPRWSVLCLGLAFGIGSTWHHFVPFHLIAADTARLISLILGAAVSGLLVATSLALLQQAVQTHERRLTTLADRVSRAEQGHGQDEELLHELRSTVAGIASASRLLGGERPLPGERAEGLHRMLRSELTRLEHMLQPTRQSTVEHVDLDALLEPLVLGVGTRGTLVEHRPSGLTVRGEADSISEVVTTLLSNSNRHAPGAQVLVTSEAAGDHIVIRIADNGPGVPPEVRSQLFSREVKGPSSPGQGLGLYIAQRTMRSQGGDLCLEESGDGACFTVKLPQAAP